ncbi:hypothetical protein CYLTODRAFT_447608 [Cylindrobasidium torrendii FP15055 ss-10]|uniref:Uncharacterized protein n=1 Tax=Cylindrobasidium torrendii FP15055 ss-10 TaxID=1314674 RepID=A0A0D7AUM6_9AGAR|nr:hypothetical protein CYLTODRAFT_447608 [Cylindrobasidium torrendii FP15055 ss-10]
MFFALKDWIIRARQKLAKRKSPAVFFFDESNNTYPSKGPCPTNEEVTSHASSCVVQVECGEDSCTAIALGGGVYWAPRSIGEAAIQARTHVTARYPGREREERRLFPLCYANAIPAHPLDAHHVLMLSTYELILRRVVVMHASNKLPPFITQVLSDGPKTTWQEATGFCLLYDPSTKTGESLDWTSALVPEAWSFRLRTEATLVGFGDPSVPTVQTSKGHEVSLERVNEQISYQMWYAYHTCESTYSMSGGAIIAYKDAGEVDSSLAGMSVHSTREEIKSLHYNLMIPITNPLFCALLLVFVWPHIWECGTPRQKEVYTELLASVGPIVMCDLTDKLDSVLYAKIKPSWDDLQRHFGLVHAMSSASKVNVDWVQGISDFHDDPNKYTGVRYMPNGSPCIWPRPYSPNKAIVLL